MTSTLVLHVPGMTCDHCRVAVSSELYAVPGVTAVDVDLGTKLVRVTGDELDRATLVAAVDEAGFDTDDGFDSTEGI